MDDRIQKFIKATHDLAEGNYQVEVPITPADEVGQLGKALRSLAQILNSVTRNWPSSTRSRPGSIQGCCWTRFWKKSTAIFDR